VIGQKKEYSTVPHLPIDEHEVPIPEVPVHHLGGVTRCVRRRARLYAPGPFPSHPKGASQSPEERGGKERGKGRGGPPGERPPLLSGVPLRSERREGLTPFCRGLLAIVLVQWWWWGWL